MHTQTVFDPNFLSELIDQAHNPPGKDPVLGSFYSALVQQVEEDKPIAKLLMKVKKRRKDTTYKHMANLIFRAYQAVKFKQNDLSYSKTTDIPQWNEELKRVISDNLTRKYFEKLLTSRSTTTTIYQRYAGPYALITCLYGSNKVSIADLGCGGNYGLRGIELNETFKKIKDLTQKKIVSSLILKRINLKTCFAIDKENPDEEEVRLWRLACSFYPQEIEEKSRILDFEERIKKAKFVEFLRIDLLTEKKLPKVSVDIVILSTILYQLSLDRQLTLIEKAKKLLKPKGLLIVQDFAVKSLSDPGHLDFNESWFGKSFSYRTFVTNAKNNFEFLEVLKWNNDRCQIVKKGEDFEKIFKKLT